MTDRIKGFYVVLDDIMRTDDAEPLIEAVLMLKGVLDVKVSISNSDDWMIRSQVKSELRQKLIEILE